jgi:hypothetical protein
MLKTIAAVVFCTGFCNASLQAQNAETITTNTKDFFQLQTALNLAESNKKPDVINIGEGTISLKGLNQHFRYEPPYRPTPEMEEHYPLTINGAGIDKTIIDGAGGSIFTIMTGRMSDDFGANITVSNICFKNVKDFGGGSALGIGTKKAAIRIENCKFVNCKGSEGAALMAVSQDKNISGTVYVRKCVIDSCRGAVKLSSNNLVTIEKCAFTNNTTHPALGLFSLFGTLEMNENTFTNNSTTTDAPVQCIVLGLGEIKVTRNTFSGNSGQASGALRIGAVNSKIKLFRNEFLSNHGTESGAAYISNNGEGNITVFRNVFTCLLYTSPSPRDRQKSRMPSSA